MNRKHFLLLLFCLLHVAAFTQGNRLTVIARNGLNLRSHPGLAAPSLKRLPYGSAVTALQAYPEDLRNLPDTVRIDGQKGIWLQVQAGNVQGWAFSAWLHPRVLPQVSLWDGYTLTMMPPSAQYAHVLLPLTGKFCEYGLYRHDSLHLELRPVRLQYYTIPFGDETYVQICPSLADTALFYLLSRSDIQPGLIRAADPALYYHKSVPYYISEDHYYSSDMGLYLDAHRSYGRDSVCDLEVVVRCQNRSQTLFRSEGDCRIDITVPFIGDLDRDGLPDVYWTRSNLIGSVSELWLTSRAPKGMLMGKAGVYEDCCY